MSNTSGGGHIIHPIHVPNTTSISNTSGIPNVPNTNPTLTADDIILTSPVFRLYRQHSMIRTWLLSRQIPPTSSHTTLQNAVAKEFHCHIPATPSVTTSSAIATEQSSLQLHRRRTLLYYPYITIQPGVTLGCVFGSRYERDQVWGLGWNEHPPNCCKFVYDENQEESLTFIWNETLGQVAIVWVKSIGSDGWEVRRELLVFEIDNSLTGLEGARRKVWMKLVQWKECENCGKRMGDCVCMGIGVSQGNQKAQDAERKGLMASPVDFTCFDVKILDGVYQCHVEADTYNPDTYVLLSRKSVTFTTEIVNANVDSMHLFRPESAGLGEGLLESSGVSEGSLNVVPTQGLLMQGGPTMPIIERQILSDNLIRYLRKCADDVKTEEESIADTAGSGGNDGGGVVGSVSSTTTTDLSATKRRNGHRTQPIRLADIVNILYRLEKEGDSSGADSENGKKRRKKRGPYRKRGEIDKATRDHERKLKNRELAHAANQKKRERTRAMELELRILRKAVRSILDYTRELEGVNAILAQLVTQSGNTARPGHPSPPLTSTGLPGIVPASFPEDKPNIF